MIEIEVGTFTVIFLLSFLFLRSFIGKRVQIGSRVGAMTAHEVNVGEGQRPDGRRGMLKHGRRTTWLKQFDSVLRRAEIDLSATEFVLRWVLIEACFSTAACLAWGFGGVLLVIAVGFLVTLLYIRSRGLRRTRRFNEGLQDVLIMISNSLRSGHSFVQAMQLVCMDMEGPIHEEFSRIIAEMQVGVGLEDALQRANERIGSEDFDLIVTAISIQRQVGGNLSEVLDKISDTIRERVRVKREVKALTSQGRLSSLIFMVLPAGVGGLLFLMEPAYIEVLFTTTAGWVLLVIAGGGQAVGYFFIRKIVNVEL